jgi:hypothetical protein
VDRVCFGLPQFEDIDSDEVPNGEAPNGEAPNDGALTRQVADDSSSDDERIDFPGEHRFVPDAQEALENAEALAKAIDTEESFIQGA